MNRTALASLCLSLTTTAAACAGHTDDVEVADSSAEIIGGVPAFSPRLDAVGSLDTFREDGSLRQRCTGTLIAPTVVLTAEHCLEPLTEGPAVFAIGPDGEAPSRTVPIIGFAAELSLPDGGFLDLGNDIAVAHLAAPVTDVTPMAFARFDPSLVGSRFSVLGYGVQNNDLGGVTRLAGSVTLRALTGRILEIALGSFEELVAFNPHFAPPIPEDELEEAFEGWRLLEGVDAYFGGAPGDANPCSGDSGGPMIKNVGGELTVMAVLSGGLFTTVQRCNFGGINSVLNEASIAFLQREIVCPLVPEEGRCDGDIAVRCSADNEGPRRILRADCAELGQSCGVDEAGAVGCVDAI